MISNIQSSRVTSRMVANYHELCPNGTDLCNSRIVSGRGATKMSRPAMPNAGLSALHRIVDRRGLRLLRNKK